MIAGVVVTPLAVIGNAGGSVRHVLKASSGGFSGFGEAYLSEIEAGAVKAWKRHSRMVCNLIGVIGHIRVQLLDLRQHSSSCGQSAEVFLGPANYQRLTIPIGIWFGFSGNAATTSVLLNIASIEHDPREAETAPMDDPRFAGLSW